jgi:ATP-dependent protease ClpP protease subunit
MSLRKLPKIEGLSKPRAYSFDAPSTLLERWAATPQMADSGDNTIGIMDVIGEDWWTGEGVTAKRISGALRAIGNNPVLVTINSPGGDMFEGLAIYNLLREHPAEVTVRVLALAASAASIIAMAGDRIEMSLGSMMMIHNAWGMVVGNRHDFAEAATMFDTFDRSMATIYAARSGLSDDEVMALMDGPGRASDGTFLTAEEAVEMGLADAVTETTPQPAPASRANTHVMAKRRIEAALAKEGVSRRDRQALLSEIQGERDAAPNAARDAGEFNAGLARLLETIRR